jgi:hypothetical protein
MESGEQLSVIGKYLRCEFAFGMLKFFERRDFGEHPY